MDLLKNASYVCTVAWMLFTMSHIIYKLKILKVENKMYLLKNASYMYCSLDVFYNIT